MLHVARLARLELPEDEVERLPAQLSAILEAVGKVAELDLADVPPTSHPLDLVNVWAEDEPRARRCRSTRRSRTRPTRDGDLVPACRRPGMRRSRDRHAAAHRRGGDRAARARRGLRRRAPRAPTCDAIAERDAELHAYLRTVEEPSGDGVPIALKDVISTKGVETTAGSKILDGYVPVFDATVAARCKAAGPAAARQDEHGRVRDGLVDRELRLRAVAQPVGSDPRARRLVAAAPPPPSRPGSRRGRSAPTRAARSSSRPRSAATSACGRPTAPSRATASSPSPRASTRSARSRRPCATARSSTGSSPAATRCDSTTVELPEPVELPEARGPERPAHRRPEGAERGGGDRAGRPRGGRRARSSSRASSAPRSASATCPRSVEYGLPCYYLIAPAEASSNLARYDGVRYGLRVEAGDIREMYERTRDEGFGDEPKRRIMLGTYALSAGLLRRVLRPGAEGAHAASATSTPPPSSSSTCSPRRPRRRWRSRSATSTADPLAMYAADVLTIPSCLAGLPGLSIPCGLSEGLPVGLQLIGPPVRREPLFRAGHALERALGFDSVPERLRVTWEPVIGLEIHVQLKTRTKMFCRCAAASSAPPNTQTCPVCLAHPGRAAGAEPQAVEWTIKLGLALGCEIAAARGLPPQELLLPRPSQGLSDLPVRPAALRERPVRCARRRRRHGSGSCARTSRRTRRRRSTSAARTGRIGGADDSLVDFNRGGTPLVEIVTAPDIRSAERGEALPAAAAPDGRRARHLGRGDGEGHAALRRQRLGAPEGRTSSARAAS